jgi:hypothetical protein
MDANQVEKSLRTLSELLICFQSWEPESRVMGNVKSSDASDAIRISINAIINSYLYYKNICYIV